MSNSILTILERLIPKLTSPFGELILGYDLLGEYCARLALYYLCFRIHHALSSTEPCGYIWFSLSTTHVHDISVRI